MEFVLIQIFNIFHEVMTSICMYFPYHHKLTLLEICMEKYSPLFQY